MVLNVSVSDIPYESKPRVNKITWIPQILLMDEIFGLLLNGYSIAPDFGYNKPFSKGRDKKNWKLCQYVFIDIDKTKLEFDDLIELLFHRNDYLKPNLIYTTFSHKKKGNRYRLFYCFDEPITDQMVYTEVSMFYIKSVSELIHEAVDSCSKVITQPIHGTTPNDKDYRSIQYLTPHSLKEVIAMIPKKERNDVKKKETKSTSDLTYKGYVDNFTDEEKALLTSISITQYLQRSKNLFKIYEDNWEQLGYKAKTKDVIDVKPILTQKNPKTGLHEIRKIKDGERRKHKIWAAGMKMRIINPNINKHELLYNLAHWMMTYTLRGDDPITWNHLFFICNNVINHDIEVYKEKRLNLLKKPDHIVYNPHIKLRKEKNDDIKSQLMNLEDKSIKNLMKVFNISRKTAYRYKERFPECFND